jgi:hypothetical protein
MRDLEQRFEVVDFASVSPSCEFRRKLSMRSIAAHELVLKGVCFLTG